jgi:hypothetical protein
MEVTFVAGRLENQTHTDTGVGRPADRQAGVEHSLFVRARWGDAGPHSRRTPKSLVVLHNNTPFSQAVKNED